MTMTPEQAEKSARLQAKLRGGGWKAWWCGPYKGYTEETSRPGLWMLNDGTAHHKPLDPYNPADMWELMKLAKINVVPPLDDDLDEWEAWPPDNARFAGWGTGPLEAVQAAWLKLIEEQGDD